MSASHFINGEWIEGAGDLFSSHEPVSGDVVWTGRSAMGDDVDRAVRAGRTSSKEWANLPIERRCGSCQMLMT